MKTIAVDLGGTIIKIGLVHDGELMAFQTIEAHSEAGLLQTLPRIEQAIKGLLEDHQLTLNQRTGIGFGFPGLVDSVVMRVLSTNEKYDDALQVDLKGWAKEALDLPLFLENDARLALLGEWHYGAGIGKDNLVMVTLGTGVGTAAIINGRLLRGKHFQAGCLGGHFTIQLHGKKCTCGNRGCVEAEASTWQLQRSMEKGQPKNFKEVFQRAHQGDEACLAIRHHCLQVWSAGVVNLIHAYDPELVIIGGGVIKSAEVIIPFIQKYVDEYAWTPWGRVKIISAAIPDHSGLLGAHYLVKEKIQSTHV